MLAALDILAGKFVQPISSDLKVASHSETSLDSGLDQARIADVSWKSVVRSFVPPVRSRLRRVEMYIRDLPRDKLTKLCNNYGTDKGSRMLAVMATRNMPATHLITNRLPCGCRRSITETGRPYSASRI